MRLMGLLLDQKRQVVWTCGAYSTTSRASTQTQARAASIALAPILGRGHEVERSLRQLPNQECAFDNILATRVNNPGCRLSMLMPDRLQPMLDRAPRSKG
jgi:hypothetical protein